MIARRRAIALLVVSNASVACVHVYADLDARVEPEGSVRVDGGGKTLSIANTDPTLCPSISPARQGATDDAGVEYADPDAAYPVLADPACRRPGLVCEYGTSSDRECNGVFSCLGSGSDGWHTRAHQRCFEKSSCDPTATMDALDGRPCDLEPGATDADDAICNVLDGVCACTTGRGGAETHPRSWVCSRPIATCPIHRPSIGQPCASDLFCDYGSCTSKRGIAVVCRNGAWQESSRSCE